MGKVSEGSARRHYLGVILRNLVELQQLSSYWVSNTKKFYFWLDKAADESYGVLAMPRLLV